MRLATDSSAVPDEEWIECFNRRVVRGEADECWRWGGGEKAIRGQAFIRRHCTSAPRIALRIRLGRWPERHLYACHTCDHPWCVNPAHLWEGTPSENLVDCVQKRRHPHAKLTPENIHEIRSLLPMTGIRTIARRFEVDHKLIIGIRDGRYWGWLTNTATQEPTP